MAMAVGRRKLGWQLAGKVSVGLALASFSISAIGFPLPATHIKDPSVPFPCQDHACGCLSAEQCWRHCCCFTVAERWAWAEAHHVDPAGVNFLFGDGSVHNISNSIDGVTYEALLTRAGGELASGDDY